MGNIDDDNSDNLITPEMIKAGATAIREYDPQYEMPEDAAVEVYLAMIKARGCGSDRTPKNTQPDS